MATIPAMKTIAGTHGKLWVNGELIAEVTKFEAKVTFNRAEVKMGFSVESKITGAAGSGTMTLAKTYSRFNDYYKEMLKGKDQRFVLVSALEDPDAYGYERVTINNVWFNEQILPTWEKGNVAEQAIPFGFTPEDLDWLDEIRKEGESGMLQRAGRKIADAAGGVLSGLQNEIREGLNV